MRRDNRERLSRREFMKIGSASLIASQLVGELGKHVGHDMTLEEIRDFVELVAANREIDAMRFGTQALHQDNVFLCCVPWEHQNQETQLEHIIRSSRLEYLDNRQDGPILGLPIITTKETPIYTETTFPGGELYNYAEGSYFKPYWFTVSGLKFDHLPSEITPDLRVPGQPEDLVPIMAYLPHVTGLLPAVYRAVVGYVPEIKRMRSRFMRKLYGRGNDEGIISTYAFSDQIKIYPSKIYNILTALICISEWQRDNGPFTQDREYSFLEMSGVSQRNADRYIFWGYGVCASATTMSKTIFLSASQGLTEITKRILHKPVCQYAINAYDLAVTKENSDAQVFTVPGQDWDYIYNADFKFVLTPGAPDMHLSFAANVNTADEPVRFGNPGRHKKQYPCDARLTFSMTLTTKQPDYDEVIRNLQKVRDDYEEFHVFADGFYAGKPLPSDS